MYNVSTEYQTHIKDTVRNPSYMKINFSIVDPDASLASTLTSNGQMPYSNVTHIELPRVVDESYTTLEHNRLILNGIGTLAPDSAPYIDEGYIGNIVSGADCTWSVNPKITIYFGASYFTLMGLTFTFDFINNEYPAEMQLIAYDGATEVLNTIFYPDDSEIYSLINSIPECNKIEIIALKSSLPYRRFRIENLMFGITKIFKGNVIQKATWKRDVDLINSKLPTITFDFSILDLDREYDPENPTGLYPYIESRQPISFDIGYELPDGIIEWQDCGNMFTTGEISMSSNSSIPVVTIKTQSAIAYCDKIYNQGVYSATPVTLYDLADTILTYADLPLDSEGNERWILDASLSSYSTMMPLPKDSVKNLLQLIANAGMCVLDVDRDGNITIKPHSETASGFGLEFGDITSVPTVNKYPLLGGVDASVNTLNIATTTSELAKFDITGASSTVYEFEYDMAKTITNSVTGTLVVNSIQYFARMARVTLTGTGTITFTGYKIDVKTDTASVEFNPDGDRCPISNELITNRKHALAYASWVGAYVNRRNEYTFTDRGYPELDSGDEITIETLYSKDVDAIDVTLLSSEITYDGAITGKSKVLMK